MTSVIQDSMRGHTRICTYKSQLVAVKEINKPYVDIKNEQIRQELRIVSLNFSTKHYQLFDIMSLFKGCIDFQKKFPFQMNCFERDFHSQQYHKAIQNFHSSVRPNFVLGKIYPQY